MTGLRRSAARTSRRTIYRATHTHTHTPTGKMAIVRARPERTHRVSIAAARPPARRIARVRWLSVFPGNKRSRSDFVEIDPNFPASRRARAHGFANFLRERMSGVYVSLLNRLGARQPPTLPDARLFAAPPLPSASRHSRSEMSRREQIPGCTGYVPGTTRERTSFGFGSSQDYAITLED